MKKRTSALLAALFAAGVFGLSSQTVHAADNEAAMPVQTQASEQAQTTQTTADATAATGQKAATAQTTANQQAKKPAMTQQHYVGQVNYRYPYGVNLW